MFMYVISLKPETWETGIVLTGRRPQVRSGHSHTLVGNKLVSFCSFGKVVCTRELKIDCQMVPFSPYISGNIVTMVTSSSISLGIG